MKFYKYLLYLAPVIIFIVVVTIKEMEQKELGSKSNPIRIYFTPSLEAKSLTTSSKSLIDYLEKETGYYFTSAVPSSFVAVVEAFGSKRADIALINTFSYLMAHEKYGVTARLRIVRDNNQKSYRGQIVTHVDSGIDSLSDLNGKRFAFVDPSSTSGYILPKALLEKQGIQIAEGMFAMKHDNVISMVYQGQVDAGATYYSPPDPVTGNILDARMRVKTQYPDVEKKVKIIALTEEIPNDPIVFRKGLPVEMQKRIVSAMIKFSTTPEGSAALYKLSEICGLLETTDDDYDPLRNILRGLHMNLDNLIKK